MAIQKRALVLPSVSLGCDPEAFFTRKGQVIGAERVIPEGGLRGPSYSIPVVIDGVQLEIHPAVTGCRQSMACFLKDGFYAIHKRLQELGDPDIQLSFQSHYTVPREELDSLSDACKILGCSPSLNHYGFEDLGVDVATFAERSAGGHLHFGLDTTYVRPEFVVPCLDAVLGNFCVMVDRDPYAPARRKVYGRAGEYRLPKHGIEYRTLSNFWLRDYALQSMVMGIARWALGVAYTQSCIGIAFQWDSAKTLLGDYVDPRKVQRAINTNDLQLAKENWAGVKRFCDERVDWTGTSKNGMAGPSFHLIDHFLQRIEESGLEYWFNENPYEHWLKLRYAAEVPGYEFGKTKVGVPIGWEAFLTTRVQQDYEAAGKRKAA